MLLNMHSTLLKDNNWKMAAFPARFDRYFVIPSPLGMHFLAWLSHQRSHCKNIKGLVCNVHVLFVSFVFLKQALRSSHADFHLGNHG